MPRKMKNYEDDLLTRLKDQGYAVEYLNAVLEDEGDDQQERFLMALKDVAKAHGVANIAHNSKVTREADSSCHLKLNFPWCSTRSPWLQLQG